MAERSLVKMHTFGIYPVPMNRPVICDITTFYSELGGGVTSYLDLKKKLVKKQSDIELVRILGGPKDELVIENNVRTYFIKSPKYPFAPAYRLLLNYRKITSILEKELPVAVEIECPYWLLLYALRWKKKFKSTRFFGFYRADVPDTYIVPLIKKMKLSLLAKLVKALAVKYFKTVYNRLHATLVHSDIMRDKLLSMGFTNVVTAGNLVNIKPFLKARFNSEVKDSLCPKGYKLVLYCGRLSSEKGIDVLLSLVRRWREEDKKWIVAVIGGGPLEDEIKEGSSRLENLKYLGPIKDVRKRAELFASADALVVPGSYETFSMVSLEAVAAGLPIAAALGTGGITEVVRPGVGFAVSQSDLESALSMIFSMPKGAWYSEHMRNKILKKYDPEQVIKRLCKIYGIDNKYIEREGYAVTAASGAIGDIGKVEPL